MSKTPTSFNAHQFDQDCHAFATWLTTKPTLPRPLDPQRSLELIQAWSRIRVQSQAYHTIIQTCYATPGTPFTKPLKPDITDVLEAFRIWHQHHDAPTTAAVDSPDTKNPVPSASDDPDSFSCEHALTRLFAHLPHPHAAQAAWNQWQTLDDLCATLTHTQGPTRRALVRQWITAQHFAETTPELLTLVTLMETLAQRPPDPVVPSRAAKEASPCLPS